MRHPKLSLTFVLTLLASACGGITSTASSPDDIAVPASKARAAKSAKSKAKPDVDWLFPEGEQASSPLAERRVGDFFVHRFSGTFSEKPMTLTEEVVAKAGGLIVVDYTLEQGKASKRLRVTHDIATDRVLRVREMQGDRELAAKIEDFDAMLEKTAFAPDQNEKTIASEKTTCLVGGEEVDCEKTSYSVAIGDQRATLEVTKSAAIPGRDVSGEIVDQAGKVIYRAELVDMGRGTPSGVASAE